MKKYYTTEDLREGTVAIKFKKDKKRTFDILKEAFPYDPYILPNEELEFLEKDDVLRRDFSDSTYFDEDRFWWGQLSYDTRMLPYVSEKYILLLGEVMPEDLALEDVWLEYLNAGFSGGFKDYLGAKFKCKFKKL
jgi:hypothetical protein